MTTQPPTKRWQVSRRQFLIGIGAGTATLAVGLAASAPALKREAQLTINQAFLNGEAPSSETPKAPFIWFEIHADNRAFLYIPKMEMGQGIHTTLAQVAADELELDWERVTVRQPDIRHGFDPGLLFTFGSTSTTSLYQPIREVSATLREMLRQEAIQQLGTTADALTLDKGTFKHGETVLTYGEIIANKQGEWDIPEDPAPLKDARNFRYIGQSVKRVDFKEKLTGRAVYGYDARAEGMLYGAMARPPRYQATLTHASEGTAKTLPGVVAVVIQEGFAGVVATTRRQAYAALDALELTWEGGSEMSQAELETFMRFDDRTDGVLIQREGNPNEAFQAGATLTAEYFTPMAVHAHLEPQAALAEIVNGQYIITTSTQSPEISQQSVAKGLGIEVDQVQVIPTFIGGGFGRKTGTDVALEAARLAQVVNRPVHVGWNRTEEMRYGYRRPPTINILRAQLSEDDQLVAVDHTLSSSDTLFAEGIGLPRFAQNILGADPLSASGSQLIYNIPHRAVTYHHRRLPIPTAYWRGLGSFANTFAIETFMDEIAHALQVDPLEFRLRYLPEGEIGERIKTALETVRQASNWGQSMPSGMGRGLAIAYDRKTVVALVMTVQVEGEKIRARQAWCAIDPGLVVNPDGAASQVQGQIVMGLSSALMEEQVIENGLATDSNFNTYPLITMRDTPAIEVFPLKSADAPTGGLGEPVIGTVPAAVSNAVFAVTGQRLRRMPFNLARL